jgi:hypothetical protein
MRSFLRVLLSLDLFLLGMLLILLPWMDYWDHNFFLDKYPAIIPFVLHPSLRGVVSGLGALDILLAGNMLRGRADSIATRT